jgi:hypothetical protein
MLRRLLLLIGLTIFIGFQKVEAQAVTFDTVNTTITGDTIIQEKPKGKLPKNKRPHSPKVATIMSACLPGLGQIYNGKWWKVPIVYAGLGGIGYLAISNYSNYRLYLEAYRYSTGDIQEASQKAIELAGHYASSQLQTYKESYRRDFELFTILTAAWYGLNIVDACVDGHLYSYDISDDLSLSIDPYLRQTETLVPMPQYAQIGLSFKLNF